MEPIAPSGAVFRPSGGGAGELSVLLRDGRVLHAEVLISSADGTMLLAIGRHTIPAESELRLDPGTSFLVRVEGEGEHVVLRFLAPPESEEALLAALRGVVAEERPLGELLGELARALRSAPEGSAGALLALAESLDSFVARPDASGAGLRQLLTSLGLAHEGALLALLARRAPPDAATNLRADLKARLLAAQRLLAGAGPGQEALSAAVSRALDGLEAEQLLNLAREKAGEPLVLSFPFVDGEAWATARLLVPSRRQREPEERGDDPAPCRIALEVELSALGPVRADLVLHPGFLSVRVLVARVDVARRLEDELPRLAERLQGLVRTLDVGVRVAPAAGASCGRSPLDIRYLRDHHLMNVSG